MAEYEKPIGTRSIGVLGSGSTTTCSFAAKGNRVRIFGTSATEVRITGDNTNPATAAGPVADTISVQLGSGTTVVDLWDLTDVIKIHAYGAATAGLVVSLSRIYDTSTERGQVG